MGFLLEYRKVVNNSQDFCDIVHRLCPEGLVPCKKPWTTKWNHYHREGAGHSVSSGGDEMNADQSSYVENASRGGWRIDGWSLARGLILLSSALLTTTILHYVIRAVFRG